MFLAVTGGEALYADLGHFGRKPIQAAWFFFVLPCLLINYFGQGALILSHPGGRRKSILSDGAGERSGAVDLSGDGSDGDCQSGGDHRRILIGTLRRSTSGCLPRFEVRYTSKHHAGQIYLPRVNILLLIGVLLLVGLFRSSSDWRRPMASRVSTTMVADGIMCFVVIWKLWNWRAGYGAALIVPLVVIDLTFLAANLLKLLQGAWVPLLFGIIMVVMIWTWRKGAAILIGKDLRTSRCR